MTAARMKAFLWDAFSLPLVILVYCTMNAEGMMIMADSQGIKLSKTAFPGLASLEDFEGWHSLTIAHVFAFIFLIAVWRSFVFLFNATLDRERYFRRCRWNPELFVGIVGKLAMVLIVCDGIFFYSSIASQSWGWGESYTFSFSALFLTLAYLGIIIFVSLVSFTLENAQENDHDAH